MHRPVKYVLYSHYGYREKEDFEQWNDDSEWKNDAEEAAFQKSASDAKKRMRATSDLDGVVYLANHLRELRNLLLEDPQGLIVLFYAPGFAHSLSGIASGMSKTELLKRHRSLRFAQAVSEHIERNLLRDSELQYRVRFVTALEFTALFGRMNWATAINLRWWFYGATEAMRYDAPKIVESFVRLRLLGTGVPVFRLDFDVPFRGKNSETPFLGMSEAIRDCVTAHQVRRDEASIATFLFSASYDTTAILKSDSATRDDEDAIDAAEDDEATGFDPRQKKQFDEWSGAFATRIFPALPVRPDLLKGVGKKRTLAGNGTATEYTYSWDHYATEVFSEPLARRFYGLKPTGLEGAGLKGIGKIGAHPLVSVISGALFCLSDGAILDLPPFSNFSLNASWIDDHLKYCLHRELRHLTTTDIQGGALLKDAKLDHVIVQKARAAISNLPKYVFEVYLPTLLWGSIMDAWITPNKLLKYRPEYLSEDDRNRWNSIKRSGQSEGVLTSALQTALGKGHIDKAEKQSLRAKLIEAAMVRINEVRNEWASLSDAGDETFASIWAKGTVGHYFLDLGPRALGIAEPNSPLTQELTDPLNLNRFLYDDFRTLLEDAIDYIDWTLHWPQIVQAVRSVEQGTLRTDMSWNRHSSSA